MQGLYLLPGNLKHKVSSFLCAAATADGWNAACWSACQALSCHSARQLWGPQSSTCCTAFQCSFSLLRSLQKRCPAAAVQEHVQLHCFIAAVGIHLRSGMETNSNRCTRKHNLARRCQRGRLSLAVAMTKFSHATARCLRTICL